MPHQRRALQLSEHNGYLKLETQIDARRGVREIDLLYALHEIYSFMGQISY
jgi:hypothetical protein